MTGIDELETLEQANGDVQCFLCNAQVRLIARRKRIQIHRCPGCGLRMGTGADRERVSSVVATDPEHFRLLQEEYDRHKLATSALLEARLPEYERLLGRPPRFWLEIGPGNGTLGEVLSARGIRWTGVEFDTEMARLIRARGMNVVEDDFSSINAASLKSSAGEPPGRGFDIVTFSQVLEHVTSPARFLRNALEVLRPGGILHLDVPNDAGLTAWVRSINPWSRGYGEIVPPHHLIAYDGKTLHAALQRSGLESVSVFCCAYDDPVFGLAHAHMATSRRMKLVWRTSALLRRGGNLVALARKPCNGRCEASAFV